MAVKLRLKRFGKKKAPFYRVVVLDGRTKRDGRAIEEIGKYHPLNNPSLIEIDSERALYWLSVGAQPSEQVKKLLTLTGDWGKHTGDKAAKSTVEAQPEKATADDQIKAAAKDAKAKDAAEAAKKAADEKAAEEKAAAEKAAEAPAEEAPAEEPAAAEAPAEEAPAEEAPAEEK